MEEIEKKIELLKKKFPDAEDIGIISEWEKNAKQAYLASSLKNHDGMKLVIERYKLELQKIMKSLYENEKFFETEEGIRIGQLLHARKKWCKELLNIFDIAESKMNGIISNIDKKLQDDN